jgi:drug/metabolite transporter (DMT)-like permease
MAPPAGLHDSRTLQGIGLLMLAVGCFAVLDTSVKYLGPFVPILVAVWFRYLFQALAVTVLAMPKRGRSLWQTQHPRFQLLRGALLLTVSALSFLGVQFMPVGAFTAFVMTTPLVVTLMAAVFLKEKVTPVRWALVAGGCLGALLVVQPDKDIVGWASLVPIAMVVIYAWFQILTRKMAQTEDPMTMHFYTGWVGAIITSIAVPLVWQGMPEGRTLALLGLVGLMGTVGHFLLILAFARAAASSLTPYLYTQIGFAVLCGWLVFDHVPAAMEISGIALIVLCGATASWLTARESRLPLTPPEP